MRCVVCLIRQWHPWAWIRSQLPIRTLVCLAAALLLTACETDRVATEQRLVRFIAEVAFGQSPGLDNAQAPLRLWTVPVHVRLIGVEAETFREPVREVMKQVEELTAVRVTISDTATVEDNFTVEFVPEPEHLVNGEAAPCSASVSYRDNAITSVHVRISIADRTRIKRCIAHEIAHGFGLRGHSGIVRSILSPFHQEESLTEWDQLALRVVYSGSLFPGTKKVRALPSISYRVKRHLAKRPSLVSN